ncbi:hypothetical protein ACFQE0_11180 [Methylobacterium komagatae]|uniref:DUF3551 domain-containing protein n=1 Tax=Methylobacterium komagatae TaxID=374425 RepID=A0ABW2BJQ2_9HYPH
MQMVKQNILFVIFVSLTVNIIALTGANIYSAFSSIPPRNNFEMIECGDAAGHIHKCIRIDPKAGEINDAAKGASYRVIYGQ